jgi:hypothetical protein
MTTEELAEKVRQAVTVAAGGGRYGIVFTFDLNDGDVVFDDEAFYGDLRNWASACGIDPARVLVVVGGVVTVLTEAADAPLFVNKEVE